MTFYTALGIVQDLRIFTYTAVASVIYIVNAVRSYMGENKKAYRFPLSPRGTSQKNRPGVMKFSVSLVTLP